MRILILCGGKGTRAYPLTVDVPKPLLPVAGVPVLGHLMAIYADQGYAEFVLAAGFRAGLVTDYAGGLPADWDITVVDTGLDTGTAERIMLCREHLGPTFFATYGDGLADIDLDALLECHRAHPGCATVTTVPLPSPYGTLDIAADGRVTRFQEKPLLADRWINGGFFVLDARVFDQWAGLDLERDVLPALGAAGELYAYQHRGFWRSVDTHKDLQALTDLAERGSPPWLTQ